MLAFFLKKSKMAFVSLKKIGNKILGADIVELLTDFLHISRLHYCLHQEFLFRFFLKTCKYHFRIFFKNELHVAREPFGHSNVHIWWVSYYEACGI
jgi:hypothetical protein